MLGSSHPDVADTLNNLAFVLNDKGDLEGAIAMGRQSIDTYRTSVGNEHPLVALGMHNVGIWLIDTGDYERATVVLGQALFGNPDDTLALTNMGLALRSLGRPGEAVAPLERSVAIDPENARA